MCPVQRKDVSGERRRSDEISVSRRLLIISTSRVGEEAAANLFVNIREPDLDVVYQYHSSCVSSCLSAPHICCATNLIWRKSVTKDSAKRIAWPNLADRWRKSKAIYFNSIELRAIFDLNSATRESLIEIEFANSRPSDYIWLYIWFVILPLIYNLSNNYSARV